jgi:glycosyltransferase involved in cell wall biosynthesis
VKIGFNAQIVSGSDAGVATYAKNLIKHLIIENKNHDIYFFGSPEYLSLTDAPRTHLISTSPIVNRGWKRILWEQFALPSKAKRSNIDVMFYPDHTASVFRKHFPNIITIHDLAFLAMPETFPIGKRLYKSVAVRQSIHKADKIIAVSHATKEECIRLLNVPKEKIKVIYNGIDSNFKKINLPDIINNTRKQFGLSKKFILFVGTLEPRKNIIRLIKAFHQLMTAGYIDHKLVIAGKKGWLYSEIFSEVDRLSLNDSVIFLNYITQNDLVNLYSLADMLVYPSLYEGFGFPPLEAMACELPVVASNISSMPEVLGDAALLVDPYSIDDISSAMTKILSDAELRKRLTEKGLQRAKQFSWQMFARELLKVFDEIGIKGFR